MQQEYFERKAAVRPDRESLPPPTRRKHQQKEENTHGDYRYFERVVQQG